MILLAESSRNFMSLIIFVCLIGFFTSCSDKQPVEKPPLLEVRVLEIKPKDTPVSIEFVGQAKSSRQVEIRARVDGFLDKVAYEEGGMVNAGDVLFQLDPKPYEADLQQAQGELALQNARLVTASANLKRIRPLADKDAVSQKDLDDAIGAEKAAQASVLAAEGSVRKAGLNLGYTTILSPLKGLASKTDFQEGSYISTGMGSLLTYVAQLDPIWVHFSVSANQVLKQRQETKEGRIIPPANDEYEVEVVLGDGTTFPDRGRINFAEPNIDPTTGTFLIRAELSNAEGLLRPGQFLKVLLHGAKRPKAILVPRTAVMQGAKGHFVWVLNSQEEPEVRFVEVGPWHGDEWFINNGLNPGDVVILDQVMRLSAGMKLKIRE